MARLEEENRKWQERNTQLLSKLKSQVAGVESDKAEQEKAFQTQQEHTEAVEKNLRTFREAHAKNNENFRARLGQMNAEKSAATAEKQELLGKISALEAEIQTLHESKTSSDAEKATGVQNTSAEATAQAATIATLTAERDALLAEKSSWVANTSTTSSSADVEEARRLWESEKAELVQARDAAQTEAKDAEKKVAASKAAHDKLLLKAQELSRAQKAAKETQAAAVAAAVAQAKSEEQSSAVPEDVAKKHADELQALQESLTAKHTVELKAAVDAARAENAAPPADTPVLIADAIAKHDKEQEAARQEEIMAAVERGRSEAAMKAKVKDQQLVRSQARLKELEAQILAWQKAGVLPTPAPRTPSASLSASTSAPVVSAPATAASDSAQAAKPAAAGRGGAPAGAARGGATRGAAAARGTATRARGTGLSIRGGAARAPAAAAAPAPAPAAGVSIVGAAKRPRDSEGSTEDSLAKRLKPAEPGSKPPVQIRRPPT
ncbi:hypothetical protein C8R47DRAFT_265655 [Mycena vitilis]|nr:hypothetical protein C8R47DRAFT_265655 [Mycena vitilis]